MRPQNLMIAETWPSGNVVLDHCYESGLVRGPAVHPAVWICPRVSTLVHFVWSRDSRLRQQDSFAQELGSCAAEHLALEHLDPVGMTLHDAGVPGQCEARGDGVEVAFEVLGKAPEAGQFGGGTPPLPAAPQAGPAWDASSHGAGRRTSR